MRKASGPSFTTVETRSALSAARATFISLLIRTFIMSRKADSALITNCGKIVNQNMISYPVELVPHHSDARSLSNVPLHVLPNDSRWCWIQRLWFAPSKSYIQANRSLWAVFTWNTLFSSSSPVLISSLGSSATAQGYNKSRTRAKVPCTFSFSGLLGLAG